MGALVLAMVMVVLPASAWGAPPAHGAAGARAKCVDKRPGPSPILDPGGTVEVPVAYCYDPKDKDHKGWHDYCSDSGDTWSKGPAVVSFKGPCAYHDMCLEYGWGLRRSSCDSVFSAYMKRNCERTIRHSKVEDLFEGWFIHLCRGKAERMYAGVASYSGFGALTSLLFGGSVYTRRKWGCFIQVSVGQVLCGSKTGIGGGGGSWRSR